jgi:hypothetical protein
MLPFFIYSQDNNMKFEGHSGTTVKKADNMIIATFVGQHDEYDVDRIIKEIIDFSKDMDYFYYIADLSKFEGGTREAFDNYGEFLDSLYALPNFKERLRIVPQKQQTHAKIISANNEKFETNKHTDFESIEEIKNYIKKSIIFFPYI